MVVHVVALVVVHIVVEMVVKMLVYVVVLVVVHMMFLSLKHMGEHLVVLLYATGEFCKLNSAGGTRGCTIFW